MSLGFYLTDQNVPPKANAGGDFSVTLPVSVVVVDGSKSTDDVAVTKWLWERDGTSLAAGKVINGSDNAAVLMVWIMDNLLCVKTPTNYFGNCILKYLTLLFITRKGC